jgi:hypothetical protein
VSDQRDLPPGAAPDDLPPGAAPDDLPPAATWGDFRAARERFLRLVRGKRRNPEAGADGTDPPGQLPEGDEACRGADGPCPHQGP